MGRRRRGLFKFRGRVVVVVVIIIIIIIIMAPIQALQGAYMRHELLSPVTPRCSGASWRRRAPETAGAGVQPAAPDGWRRKCRDPHTRPPTVPTYSGASEGTCYKHAEAITHVQRERLQEVTPKNLRSSVLYLGGRAAKDLQCFPACGSGDPVSSASIQ
ncbi:hypothetical protein PHYPO_G00123520 [Pangasianodon hypophthalmus]|uniref:Uncharacterized protein n=1 Tax=Pangasianodon hypophthalmus TaxID=310915 RepID=A0A5N5KZP5_PANHP|nr:hypothetical protein PHYPO_G00123520 [Pangasianodon hypophthalmus]